MTLLDVCEPLFQYICRLNRIARKAPEGLSLPQVQAEIRSLLAEMKARASADPAMRTQYEEIELVLFFFIDFMIRESGLAWARQWPSLGEERNELAGEEKFFDLLEATLSDPSPQATERLAIFYTCIGLGFTGWYTGQPEYLRNKMRECAARLSTIMDTEDRDRICPEAYDNVDTSILTEPPGTSLVGIAVCFVGLVIVLFVAQIMFYRNSANELIDALQKINETAEVGMSDNSSNGS